ncbi:MAG: tellurite resistance TerB family protein [Gammaproteobacteria bacterium]|nr:tellurite resistance TerB family protein [Gammaproteobacteria bacterium]
MDAMKILGSLLSSGALSRGSGSDVLGSLIGAVMGGGAAARPASGATAGGQGTGGMGGLGDLIGGMLSGSQQRGAAGGGGLGDLLGGLFGGSQQGGAAGSAAPAGGGGLGALIGMAMQQFGAAQQGNAPQARQQLAAQLPSGFDFDQVEQQAEILVKAMINSAKADGHVDQSEQERIVGQLGDVTQDEVAFVRRELAAPLDAQAFIRSVPRGMEQQVYTMSLMGIDLDTNQEAQYLHQLAQGLGIEADVCNQIHDKLGAPKLYR